VVIRELQSLQRTLPDNMVAFERQRLLNLIDSNVKRREIERAMGFAEELFKIELRLALISRTRLLIKYNALLLKVLVVLLGIFFVFTVLAVLNVMPLLSLVAEAVAMAGVVSGIVVDRLLAKKLAGEIAIIMDVYETGRETFVERVLTDGAEYIDSEDWLRVSI
jgi:hypothetical protein